MKNLLLVTIILCICISSVSCSSASVRTDILRSPFRCELSWSFGGESFRASLSTDSPSSASRSFFMSMLSPSSLSGIWIKRDSQGAFLYIQGKEVGSAPSQYLALVEPLLSVGDLDYLCTSSINGLPVLCYTSNGSRWYFSKGSGLPCRREAQSLTLDILWIEPL